MTIFRKSLELLRSESPSGKCAKVHTVAASSNEITRRDHSIIACSRRVYMCCSSRTFRSWCNTHSTDRQRRGCNNTPSFLQRTAPIARSLCEGWTRHDLHILVIAPFCCDRKARATCAQSFALWQQEITRRDHSIIACSRHIYMALFFAHIPFVVKHTFNGTPTERLQQIIESCKRALDLLFVKEVWKGVIEVRAVHPLTTNKSFFPR